MKTKIRMIGSWAATMTLAIVAAACQSATMGGAHGRNVAGPEISMSSAEFDQATPDASRSTAGKLAVERTGRSYSTQNDSISPPEAVESPASQARVVNGAEIQQ